MPSFKSFIRWRTITIHTFTLISTPPLWGGGGGVASDLGPKWAPHISEVGSKFVGPCHRLCICAHATTVAMSTFGFEQWFMDQCLTPFAGL